MSVLSHVHAAARSGAYTPMQVAEELYKWATPLDKLGAWTENAFSTGAISLIEWCMKDSHPATVTAWRLAKIACRVCKDPKRLRGFYCLSRAALLNRKNGVTKENISTVMNILAVALSDIEAHPTANLPAGIAMFSVVKMAADVYITEHSIVDAETAEIFTKLFVHACSDPVVLLYIRENGTARRFFVDKMGWLHDVAQKFNSYAFIDIMDAYTRDSKCARALFENACMFEVFVSASGIDKRLQQMISIVERLRTAAMHANNEWRHLNVSATRRLLALIMGQHLTSDDILRVCVLARVFDGVHTAITNAPIPDAVVLVTGVMRMFVFAATDIDLLRITKVFAIFTLSGNNRRWMLTNPVLCNQVLNKIPANMLNNNLAVHVRDRISFLRDSGVCDTDLCQYVIRSIDRATGGTVSSIKDEPVSAAVQQ